MHFIMIGLICLCMVSSSTQLVTNSDVATVNSYMGDLLHLNAVLNSLMKILHFILTQIPKIGVTSNFTRVCYYTNAGQWLAGRAKFVPSDIDPMLCTHLIYGFAHLQDYQLKSTENNDDVMYVAFNDLKKKNLQLKTMIALGGNGLKISEMAANVTNRGIFCNTTVEFLRRNGFDGLDIDWEYPTYYGSPLEDKNNFASLVTECRAVFEAEAQATGQPRLLLSAAVAPSKHRIDQAYDVPKIMAAVDFVTVMGYDIHGSWDPVTGFHSALLPDTRPDAVAYCLNYWASQGAPKSKLLMGIPAYGRSFTLTSASSHDLGSSASGGGSPGEFIKKLGFLAYHEICESILKNGTEVIVTDAGNATYAYSGVEWVGYDSQLTMTTKANWIKSNGFGGSAVWALYLDDFNDMACGQGKYPLIKQLANILK